MELISSCVNILVPHPKLMRVSIKNVHPYFKPAKTKNIIDLKAFLFVGA